MQKTQTAYAEDMMYDKLRPYQKKAVEFFQDRSYGLIADEPGLGKTAQVLFMTKDSVPCLIICPNSSKYFWASEITKWLGVHPDRVYVYESWDRYDDKDLFNQGKDYYIIHWEGLRYVPEMLGATKLRKKYGWTGKRIWKCIIVDEAHRMKNRKTHQSMIIRALNGERRFALTGTPIVNRPDELWSILNYLKPKTFSSYWNFFNTYVLAIPRIIGGQLRGYEILGIRDRKALYAELKGFVVRRLKERVQPDLPPKVYSTYQVELSKTHRKLYEDMKRDMIVQLTAEVEVAAATVLAQMTRLRQLADGPFLIEPSLPIESAKLDAVLDLLEDRGEEQTVVFTQFVGMARAIHQRLVAKKIPSGLITGKDADAPTRERLREEFQAGKLKVITLTLATGSESITLTAADTVIFVDKPWSPSVLQQAEDRVHRIGQKASSVYYISIFATDTVDDRVDELLRRKDFLFRQLFERSGGGLIKSEEVVKLL